MKKDPDFMNAVGDLCKTIGDAGWQKANELNEENNGVQIDFIDLAKAFIHCTFVTIDHVPAHLQTSLYAEMIRDLTHIAKFETREEIFGQVLFLLNIYLKTSDDISPHDFIKKLTEEFPKN